MGAYSAAKLRAPEIELQKGANVGSEPLPLSCRLTDLINELHEMTSELFKLAASKSGSFRSMRFARPGNPLKAGTERLKVSVLRYAAAVDRPLRDMMQLIQSLLWQSLSIGWRFR